MDTAAAARARHDPNFQVYFHFLQQSPTTATLSSPSSTFTPYSQPQHHEIYQQPSSTTSSSSHGALKSHHQQRPCQNPQHQTQYYTQQKNSCHHSHQIQGPTSMQPPTTRRAQTFPTSSSSTTTSQYVTPDGWDGRRQNSMPLLPPIQSLLAMDDPLLGSGVHGGNWMGRKGEGESWGVRYR